MEDDDEPLYDTPAEFMSIMTFTKGVCNGQAITRSDGGDDAFTCRCTCGWTAPAADSDSGLLLARQHTGSV